MASAEGGPGACGRLHPDAATRPTCRCVRCLCWPRSPTSGRTN